MYDPLSSTLGRRPARRAAHTVAAGAGGLERWASRTLLELDDAFTCLQAVRASARAAAPARRETHSATESAAERADPRVEAAVCAPQQNLR
jgi:hypothetical protein